MSIVFRKIPLYFIIFFGNHSFHTISERGEQMVFNTGAALLDAIVLAVISREKDGTYGYKITQDVRSVQIGRAHV